MRLPRSILSLSIWPATVLVLLSLCPPFATAQEGGAEQAADPAAVPEAPPPEPRAVSTVAIARNAEAAHSRLSEVAAIAAEDPTVHEIGKELPSFLERLGDEKLTVAATRPEQLTLRRLEDRQQTWKGYRNQLNSWLSTLDERAAALGASRDEVQGLREIWIKTRDSLAEEEIPEELGGQVEGVLEKCEGVEQELGNRLGGILGWQATISAEVIQTDEVISRIENALVEARKSVFAISRPTLLRELFDTSEREQLGKKLRQFTSEVRVGWARFLEGYEKRFYGQVVVTLVLFLFIALLRRRTASWAEGDVASEPHVRILQRPLSAALLVSLIASIWLYPLAPRLIIELMVLSMVVPLLRLVPRLVPRAIRGAVYGVSVLFVLDHLGRLAADTALLERFLLLAATTIALVGLIWLLRPGGPARTIDGGPWWRAAETLARLGVPTLSLSIVANVIGMHQFAELLTGGTLGAAYVGLMLWAGALVIRGVLGGILRSQVMRKQPSIEKHGALIRARGSRVIHLVALGVWIWGTLGLFNLRDLTFGFVRDVLTKSWAVGSMSISLGAIAAFLVALWVAVTASRLIRFVLNEDILPRVDLPRGVPPTISMLVHYGIMTIGFIVALSAAGIEWGQFTIIAGALGVGIGFGLQNLVNNFVSGLILIFERPIQIGDTVEVTNLRGEVRRIGIRASVVRTFDGAEVIIPNGDLIAGQVINWTLSDRLRRIEVPVGVAYGSDPQTVQKVLIGAANRHQSCLSFPEPIALFQGFGDSSLDFKLRFWTANFDNWMTVASDVTVAVHGALKEAGIEIPFPQRDLHVRSVAEPSRLDEALGADDEQEEAG